MPDTSVMWRKSPAQVHEEYPDDELVMSTTTNVVHRKRFLFFGRFGAEYVEMHCCRQPAKPVPDKWWATPRLLACAHCFR